MKKHLRIIYMGTPEFAVEPLQSMLEAGYEVAAVITVPDKPMGRGRKIQESPVKRFASLHQIPVLQPVNLKAPGFITELQSYNANLQVVVAFRMLPEIVWQMPEFGTLNLHASLLPQYRGAAPINHAIINGETETGITTFFIEKEIDTGKIILSEKHPIFPDDDAGTLHDRLMLAGGKLIVRTLELISTNKVNEINQDVLVDKNTSLKIAPKLFKDDCRIDWNMGCKEIHNRIRGLSPYPGAFTMLELKNRPAQFLKIYKSGFQIQKVTEIPGTIVSDYKNLLSIYAENGLIHIREVQLEGKKRLNVEEFLRGTELRGSRIIKSN